MMARRSKENKKSERRQAQRAYRLHNREQSDAFFHIQGPMPFDMRQELLRIISKSPHSNKEWRILARSHPKTLGFITQIRSMFLTSCNQDAFRKYFPRYSVGQSLQGRHCVLWAFPLKRIIWDIKEESLPDSAYFMPEHVRLPADNIVFSKHAMERIVERYGNNKQVALPPPLRSLYFPMILNVFSFATMSLVNINDRLYLHCTGSKDEDQDIVLCQGHFPLTEWKGHLLATTFLFEDWVSPNVKDGECGF